VSWTMIISLWFCPLATWAAVAIHVRLSRRDDARERAHRAAVQEINARFMEWFERTCASTRERQSKGGPGAPVH
jgi:hypothetical protein